MEFTDFEREFARRTLDNLNNFDNQTQNGLSYYEVTQLINSLFGIIIFLNSKGMVNTNKEIEFYGVSVNWLNKRFKRKSDKNMVGIIRHLRNSLSHGEIIPNQKEGKIIGFRFSDIDFDTKIKFWQLDLDIPTIRKIAEDLVAAIPKIH